MTNKDKWDAYTSNLCSPQNYLDWSFKFVIAASLERRVWLGYEAMQLFPNVYSVLVGRPGIGKGVAMGPAIELLRHHKRKDKGIDRVTQRDGEDIVNQEIEKTNDDMSKESDYKMANKGAPRFDPPLFPFGPDTTTFEKLIFYMGKSFRYINFPDKDKDGREKTGIYGHCSMNFILPELGSLLRKRTEDTVTLLQALYDCPKDHIYTTIGRGTDRIRMGCLNFMAGVTPDFLEMAFNERVMSQGFSSRTFFIYANKNRQNVILPEPLTEEQLGYKKELLDHVMKLAKLYGPCYIDNTTRDFIKDWFNKYENDRSLRANTSSKLDHYYARKGVHVLKVAMQNHFMEKIDFHITLEEIQSAIDDTDKEEKNMHLALNFEGKNPLGILTDKIHSFLEAKPASKVDLMMEYWKECPNGQRSIEDVLEYLIRMDKIQAIETTTKTGRIVIQYGTSNYRNIGENGSGQINTISNDRKEIGTKEDNML